MTHVLLQKTFQLFDNILEQSKVWSKPIIFQEGFSSQFDKSETSIDLSSHLSNSYADPYLFPTRFNGTVNKDRLINELKLACLQSGFNLVIRTEKRGLGKLNLYTMNMSFLFVNAVVNTGKAKIQKTNIVPQ